MHHHDLASNALGIGKAYLAGLERVATEVNRNQDFAHRPMLLLAPGQYRFTLHHLQCQRQVFLVNAHPHSRRTQRFLQIDIVQHSWHASLGKLPLEHNSTVVGVDGQCYESVGIVSALCH